MPDPANALERAATYADLARVADAEVKDRRDARNAAMREALEAGASLAEIGAAVGISTEAVSKALGRPDAAAWHARRGTVAK